MYKIIIVLILVSTFFSCSLDKFIIRQSSILLDYGSIALYEETDLVIAEQALASNIKLLEGMVKGDPENCELLLLTSQAISGYVLGFVEDEEPERAKPLYLRARDYAARVLKQNDFNLTEENLLIEQYQKNVASIEDEDIDALFWSAFCWAGWINLSLDNPQAFVDLPKVESLMNRVLEIDSSYYHGAALLFFGGIWGTKPKMLGGDPEKAKQYFDKNLEITNGNFLLTYVYYAKYYAAKILEEDLFKQYLKTVKDTPNDVLPGEQLLNAIAKKKADFLLARTEDLF